MANCRVPAACSTILLLSWRYVDGAGFPTFRALRVFGIPSSLTSKDVLQAVCMTGGRWTPKDNRGNAQSMRAEVGEVTSLRLPQHFWSQISAQAARANYTDQSVHPPLCEYARLMRRGSTCLSECARDGVRTEAIRVDRCCPMSCHKDSRNES